MLPAGQAIEDKGLGVAKSNATVRRALGDGLADEGRWRDAVQRNDSRAITIYRVSLDYPRPATLGRRQLCIKMKLRPVYAMPPVSIIGIDKLKHFAYAMLRR